MLDHPLQRHDEPPFVPDLDYDVGCGDLFDATPLVFDNHDVVNSNRLGERYLQAGDETAQYRPRRDARDKTRDTRRSEQTGSDLTQTREGHEDPGRADKQHEK